MDKPAFPRPASDIVSNDWDFLQHFEAQDGLTRRELFAAMAMQGILASPARGPKHVSDDRLMPLAAETAVAMADELIAALDAEPPR